jgi:hypothetical protein
MQNAENRAPIIPFMFTPSFERNGKIPIDAAKKAGGIRICGRECSITIKKVRIP